MEATTDVWEIPPESATRVNHPAPFPVGIPKRLIELYTYRDDLVLDPFIGSGTTAVAALQAGRHFAGYEIEAEYRERALDRIREEQERQAQESGLERPTVRIPGLPSPGREDEDFQSRAVREGRVVQDIAKAVLADIGFEELKEKVKIGSGVEVNISAWDQRGGLWYFDISGGFTSSRPGLARTDTLWKALGKAAVMRESGIKTPLILLTTNRPPERGAGAQALRTMVGPDKAIVDVIELLSPEDVSRLEEYALRGAPRR